MTKRMKARLADHKAKLVACTAPVEIKMEAAGDGGVVKPATFSALAYSGGRVPGYTATPAMPHDYVIDLAGTKKARTNHANLEHKSDQRVGHLTSINNDGKSLAIEGVFSAATKFRDEVVNSAKDGMPWEVSIECNLGGPKFIPKGETATVNGQKFPGPIFVMTRNKFTDVAFTSHGADDGNSVKIAASTAGESKMNEFEKWLAKLGLDAATMSDEQTSQLKEAFEAQGKLSAGGGGGSPQFKSFSDTVAEEKANRDRCLAIGKLAADAMKVNPIYLEQIEGMARLAMDNSATTPENFELELLRALRTTTGTFNGRSSRPEADPQMIECALSMGSGLPNIEKHYNEELLNRVDRSGMQGMGIQQVLLQAANSNGYVCRAGERIHNGNIREVLEYAFPPRMARLSGFAGISLSGILGNVANKELVEGYTEEDETWREIARVKPVSNFYQMTSYRLLDSLEYEEVGPTGFIKQGSLDQESYTRQAKTYAKMLGLTRTDIINDDLSAFDDLRLRLGLGGKKKFLNIFWAAFINNSSFFTAGRTNYTSGSTTNLGADGVGLGLGELAFSKMTSPTADSTKRVGQGSRANILLAPPELAVIARGLYVSENLITGASSTMTARNVFQGLYRPVIQNRLSDSAFTGYSTTAWYLFGGMLRPMVVSFLNGKETPTVESAEADFNQLGIQFRGYHDFGADQAEYLCGVKVKGSA